jgi:beta-lactamase class D
LTSKPDRKSTVQWKRTHGRVSLLIVTSTVFAMTLTAQVMSKTTRRECVMLLPLDTLTPYVSDPDECVVKTAPASTFKIPHALIALEAGVVTDPLELVPWDRTSQPFAAWERDHSLDSAVKSSVVWFFQRTARLIGRARMRDWLAELHYADDEFEGDVTLFWLNGDLVISPYEQLDFLRRLFRYEVPIKCQHVDVVKSAFTMPLGKVTNATGTHDFELHWRGLTSLHAKTGNTKVGEERVSWIVGCIETDTREYVFVSRVRAQEELSGMAGAELALKVLNDHGP